MYRLFMNFFIFCLLGYLVGSIPFGFLIMKHCKKIDIREVGSNSTGTTNVLRVGNKKLAILTLLLDSSKGFLFSVILQLIVIQSFVLYTAIFCCILGHIFPIWLKFHGGKGVATAAGIFLSLSPVVTIFCIFIWMCSVKICKISAIASLSFSFSFVIIILFRACFGKESLYMTGFTIATIWLLSFKHRNNLEQLMKKKIDTD